MRVKVYATPGARRELIEKESETTYRIKVKEPRERNLANHRLLEIVAAEFKLDESAVRLVSGHRGGVKTFLLDKT